MTGCRQVPNTRWWAEQDAPKFMSSLCLLLSCPPLGFSEVFWQSQTDSAWIPRINVGRSWWAWLGQNIQRIITPASQPLRTQWKRWQIQTPGKVLFIAHEETEQETAPLSSPCVHTLPVRVVKVEIQNQEEGDSSVSHMRCISFLHGQELLLMQNGQKCKKDRLTLFLLLFLLLLFSPKTGV